MNQLFDPGLTFDRASGDFSLGRGEVTINEFAIRNGGGRLTLGGLYSMDSENIDAELVVTLPLVDNIPWVQPWPVDCPLLREPILQVRSLRTK